MPGIRSAITLIDNFSSTMSKFVIGSNRIVESKEKMQEQLNTSSNFADKLSRLQDIEAVLITQQEQRVRLHEQLVKKYEDQVAISGRYSAEAEAILKKLLTAELALYKGADGVKKITANIEKLKKQSDKVEYPIKKSAKRQEEFNNQLRKGSNSADGLLRKVKGFVGAYSVFRGIKKGFQATIGAFAQINQQSMMMQAAFGNTDIGAVYFNSLQKFAAKTGHKMEELSQVTRNFMQLTRNTDKLRGLTEIAHRMSLRTGNIGSAEVLMQEAMRGQYTRIQRTLHLTDSQVEPLKRAVQAGSLNGIIGAFDQALNTAGLTNEIAEAFQASPLQKFNSVVANFKQKLASTGEKALERLTPLLERIDKWLHSESATKFFNAISFGISELAKGMVFIFDLVQSNWPTVQSILIMAGALIMYNIVSSLWATIPPLIAQMAPVLIIIGLIYMLAKAYIEMGGTVEQVTGFIGGLFGFLWARIYNGIAFAWNGVASFAEFLANLFIDPVYAIDKLFYDLALNIAKVLDSVIQAVAGGLNWIIRQSNKFLKTNYDEVQWDYVTNLITKFEEKAPTSEKDVWKATRMDYKDYTEEFSKGYDIGKLMPDKINEGINSVTYAINNLTDIEAKWNALQYDTLGSIDGNTKQMTEEDLKWLRDAAEQETVNRVTAATLAPQMSFNFGDVRETADVDGIVDHVQKVLTELLNNTAEGVHA